MTRQAVSRRVRAWKQDGLVEDPHVPGRHPGHRLAHRRRHDRRRPALAPLRTDVATAAHRHAVGLVRAEAEAMGLGWICERELREGLGGRPLHLPDGVVLSTDDRGKEWRTAVEVELTRKTEARVAAILRHLLAEYDDVVYRAAPARRRWSQRLSAPLSDAGRQRISIRPYPPPTLAEVA